MKAIWMLNFSEILLFWSTFGPSWKWSYFISVRKIKNISWNLTSLRGEGWLQGAVKDDIWRCKIIRVKRGVCKVTGMVFQCQEYSNNFFLNVTILEKVLKLLFLTPKIVENIVEIIFIFTVVKNHTINFADIPFVQQDHWNLSIINKDLEIILKILILISSCLNIFGHIWAKL